MEDGDEEILTALEGASRRVDDMTDQELLELMQTANRVREQLNNNSIDTDQFAFVMLQLSIEAKSKRKPKSPYLTWRLFERVEPHQRSMDGVVLVGKPFMPTGYGKQLNYIGQYLKNQYKVLHVSDFGYDLNSFQFNGVEVAPIESKPGNLTNHYLKATIDLWLERENIDRWVLIAW